MRLELIHINTGPMSRPEALVSAARAAEAAGFDSVWARGHGWYGYFLTPEQAAASLAGLAGL
jgi:alkanesulfonate monooxygenase SsuD/methylene tetrahydromethanopterin reductase-like flavin-dependent oxidoreductase (luciferase family)